MQRKTRRCTSCRGRRVDHQFVEIMMTLLVRDGFRDRMVAIDANCISVHPRKTQRRLQEAVDKIDLEILYAKYYGGEVARVR